VKAKGTRRKARGERGEGSDSVSPFSRRALTVAVVGAGRLGTALARALDARGYEIRALVSRSAASARRAATRAGVKTTTALAAARLDALPPTDIVFITTPDDRVAATAARLAALPHTALSHGVVLHTSGALSSDVLAPLRERGYGVGSMHPLAAVSEAAAGAESLSRAFYCVEGDARASRVARRVVRDLGGRSFSIKARDKALYHAAAVMTAGHTVALFDAAARLLASCGLDEPRARAVLLPLLRSTLDNLTRQPPARALTGTFARADVDTVRRHLAALRASDVPGALDAYTLLGRLSLRLAAAHGADADALEQIERALGEVTSDE
jgi:predicted short-subunit dehydrogenase-like oxidoreductase (DUF2520 family)